MPRKRKDPSPQRAVTIFRPLAQGLLVGLDRAESLVESRRLVEARDLLESLDRRYPRQADLLYDLLNVYYDLKDMQGYRTAAERLSRVVSDDPDVDMGLAGAYMVNLQLVKSLRAFGRFVARWPDHPRAPEARKTMSELEELLREQLEELGIPGDEGLEIAELNEETLTLLEQGDYPGARKAAERLLQRKPDFLPALNNLSMLHWLEGHSDRAISAAEKVLAADPGNVHALSNIVRFLCAGGRTAEARELGERLKATQSRGTDIWTKKAEGLSYLGDDEGVLAILNSAEKEEGRKGTHRNPLLYHLAGVAAMRLGREKEARRYWQEALKLAPGFELAAGNLDDLRKPVEERHAPWPFTLDYWLPSRTIEDLRSTVPTPGGKQGKSSRASDEVVERAFRRSLRAHPEIEALIPTLLDRGDPVGREFALRVARLLRTPEMLAALRDFALGKRGPDSVRLEAANLAIEAELIPAGEVRLWSHGEWRDVLLMTFEISDEPEHGYVSDEAEEPMSEALDALRAGDGEEAELLLNQVIEIEGSDAPTMPTTLNNLAAAYELQGRHDESYALLERLRTEYPDYIFPSIGLAKMSILDKKPEKAKELLDPLLRRSRYHYLEFSALCDAYVAMHHAMRNRDAARSWLDMWAGTDPDNPALKYWQRRLGR
jgi:tetratricopeptide (TPR) repeat protein